MAVAGWRWLLGALVVVPLLTAASAGNAADPNLAATAGPAGFVRLGVLHILLGWDHLLFLLALLIGATSLRRVIGLASAFTLTHSLTLSLAACGVVHAPAAVVEPLIAASIVWVAIENMFGRDRPRWRLAAALGFGLVHGLGFADALDPFALAGWRLAQALLGFNIGVEIGQAAAIAVMLPMLYGLGRLARTAPVQRLASLAVALAGAWWLIERLALG
jgi:hydrogenase/urease accessory protein HupE